ncbi:MAG: DUF72 domain-containing protein [Gemmatimonadales bacterium]
MIRVGPAGWSYPDSPGRVYPADVPTKFDVLAFTASYFDTIEINASFYAPQPARNYVSWARRVAKNERFKFTAKLWQRFTHQKAAESRKLRAEWTADEVRQVTDGLQVLRDANRLGAVLAQFPWSFKPSTFNFRLLTRLSEDFGGWPVVVELRHGAWAHHEHAILLKKLGLGFCNIDQPVIGESLGPTAGVTSDVGYVRFHGRRYDRWFEDNEDTAQRYDYLYTAEELQPWAERIRKIAGAEGVKEVYVVSNNHFEGKGPANALMIRSMLEAKKIKAPPVLFEHYGSALAPYAVPSDVPF